MFQKPCNLSRASVAWFGGGGGGGTDINQMPGGFRSWQREHKDIGKGYDFQKKELGDFRSEDPFLSVAGPQAIDWFKNRLPQMLKQFPGFGEEIKGFQGQLGDISQQVGGRLSDVYGKLGGLGQTVQGWLGAPGGPQSIIQSGGALTPGLARDVAQQTRGIASAQGGARSSGALGQELLNRDAYREARLGRAQQAGAGMIGQIGGLTGQQGQVAATQAGLQQGILGQQAGLVGQRANLLGQEQALQTGGLSQVLNTGAQGVSQFGALTNPILAYLGQMFGGNQQAAIAQAQVNAGANAAGDSKTSSGIGNILSIVGPILGAVLSDERIKTKVKKTGLKMEGNIPVKTFEYKTRPGVRFVGAMAQDIEKVYPSAVLTDPVSGVKFVDPLFRPRELEKKEA